MTCRSGNVRFKSHNAHSKTGAVSMQMFWNHISTNKRKRKKESYEGRKKEEKKEERNKGLTLNGRLCRPFLKVPRLPPGTVGRSASLSLFFSFSSLSCRWGEMRGGEDMVMIGDQQWKWRWIEDYVMWWVRIAAPVPFSLMHHSRFQS